MVFSYFLYAGRCWLYYVLHGNRSDLIPVQLEVDQATFQCRVIVCIFSGDRMLYLDPAGASGLADHQCQLCRDLHMVRHYGAGAAAQQIKPADPAEK